MSTQGLKRRIYRIPLWERFVDLDNFAFNEKCLHIDAVGVFIRYNKGQEHLLTPENIRRYLIGRKSTWCYVEAGSADEAIGKFYSEWHGASIGGDTLESKALWVDTEKETEEFPYCNLLRKNQRDEFICGEEVLDNDDSYLNGNGELGICVIEGYDGIEGCPIQAYRNLRHVVEKDKYHNLPVEEIRLFVFGQIVAFKWIDCDELIRRASCIFDDKKRDFEELKESIEAIEKNTVKSPPTGVGKW